jgi:hypothetical protein
MGMFFEMLSAINDPHRQGSIEQLSGIMSNIQNVQSQENIDPATMQRVMSAIGPSIQTALTQQPNTGNFVGDVLKQLAGAGGNSSAIQALFTPQLQQQMFDRVAAKTGMSRNRVQSFVPILLPLVCQFFNLGVGKPGMNGKHENSIVSAFMNAGQGTGGDLGEVFKFANRFLQPA